MASPASHGEMVRAAFLSRLGGNTPANVIYIDFNGTTGSNGTEQALDALAKSALPVDVVNLSRSPGRYDTADLEKAGITPANIRNSGRPVPAFPNDDLDEGYSSATEAVTAWATPLKRLYTEKGTQVFAAAGNAGVSFMNLNTTGKVTTVGGDPWAVGTPFAELKTDVAFPMPASVAVTPPSPESIAQYEQALAKYEGKPLANLQGSRDDLSRIMELDRQIPSHLLETDYQRFQEFIRAIDQISAGKVYALEDLSATGFVSPEKIEMMGRHNPDATHITGDGLISIMTTPDSGSPLVDAESTQTNDQPVLLLSVDRDGILRGSRADERPATQNLAGTSFNTPQAAGAFARNLATQNASQSQLPTADALQRATVLPLTEERSTETDLRQMFMLQQLGGREE